MTSTGSARRASQIGNHQSEMPLAPEAVLGLWDELPILIPTECGRDSAREATRHGFRVEHASSSASFTARNSDLRARSGR